MSKKAPGRPFVKGDPRTGRRPGAVGKKTLAIQELARSLTTDNPDYINSLRRRIKDDKLAPAVENTLLYYAHGKPKDTVEIQGADGGPLTSIMRVIVDPAHARPTD